MQTCLKYMYMKLVVFFSEINLDSTIIDIIIFTSFIFQSSKLDVSTLNANFSFLSTRDISDMARIGTKQQTDVNFGRRKTAEINNIFL